MPWKLSPKIKIYEALGSIGDKRISVSANTAEVYSSLPKVDPSESRNKKYIVKYDPENNAIMANDNASYQARRPDRLGRLSWISFYCISPGKWNY